jgi:hypothetical protein
LIFDFCGELENARARQASPLQKSIIPCHPWQGLENPSRALRASVIKGVRIFKQEVAEETKNE